MSKPYYNMISFCPEIMRVNEEATEKVRADPVYRRYKDWLLNCNCIFPGVRSI